MKSRVLISRWLRGIWKRPNATDSTYGFLKWDNHCKNWLEFWTTSMRNYQMYNHFTDLNANSFPLIYSGEIKIWVNDELNEEIIAMWAAFEALTFRSGGIVFHWTVSDREDRVLRQFTHFSCCSSDYSLKFVPKTSRLYKYSQHGVAKASHVEKRRQRGKLFEKLENQTPFVGKFVQMRVQARPAEQRGHGNPSHDISSKVRAASVSTRIRQNLVICLGRFIDVYRAPSLALCSGFVVNCFIF